MAALQLLCYDFSFVWGVVYVYALAKEGGYGSRGFCEVQCDFPELGGFVYVESLRRRTI